MTTETRLFGTITIEDEKLITFPEGIVGFPFLKQFALIHDAENENAPIMWLQSMEEPTFAMPVIEPLLVVDNYNPTVNDEYMEPVGELAEDQIYSLVTITVPPQIENMSVNLKAPIVINMANNKAVQIIVEDDYKVKHPIYETLKKRREGNVC
ncbi:MAG: flagellar assembly protein FliW [Lachnospiraceae bacterium]|nr:flagellar assembly protein FliW [bacterium]MDY5516639.1 flagellar assembly protein FliW [Lachnospiraceae bacterium]